MREVTLPSGTKLTVHLALFSQSKNLYQALAEDMRSLKISDDDDIDSNLWKDIFCTVLASKKIEAALWECMKCCLYGDLKITPATFEPEDARGDYFEVCYEVAKDNIAPFLKSLKQRFSEALGTIKRNPKSE